jgi:hypothetical protein
MHSVEGEVKHTKVSLCPNHHDLDSNNLSFLQDRVGVKKENKVFQREPAV